MFAYGSAVVTCLVLIVGAPSAAAKQPPLCHTKAPQQVAPNSWEPTQTQLAPTGVSAIRLCRYTGLNDHPRLRIARATLVSRQVWITRLVRRFNALPPPPPGATACPADFGTEIVALLSYPDGHTVTISVNLTGCSSATNGNLYRRTGPTLLIELEHLTGLRP
jgi:hypothetical protein